MGAGRGPGRFAFVVATMVAVLAGAGGLGSVPGVGAAVPSPHVRGPITGGLHGHPMFDSWFDLRPLGYEEAEYFVSGTARTVAGGSPAAYTTRIIVTRPIDAARFNGTVLLDWVNVTAQFENAVDSLEAREELLRAGYAWVWVSAQKAGICCTPLTPKVWDPVRYHGLHHPGDAYAADIFSQVARAVRAPLGANPFAGLTVQQVLASGQSQSADELYSYVTQVQATAGVIDGFLIHGGGSKTYATPPSVPVLHLLSDEEAAPDAPNTTTNYRLWEIAGTAHSDFWLGYNSVVGQGPRVLLDRAQRPASARTTVARTAGNYGEIVHPLDAACILAGSTMPMRYAVSSAIAHLDAWARTGVAPANGPRFRFSGSQRATDQFGNTLGGIRLPPIDVPVARYETTTCVLGGLTVPFTDAQLHALYPTHQGYYSKMVARTQAAVAAGWLLAPDADDLLARACAAKVRWGGTAGTPCHP